MHTALRSGLMADYPLAFAIGSGSHAQGYAVAIGGRFFQSPIAAYRQGTSWNVAPGYEGITAPDFNRPITNECLLCHSSGDPQVREAITCHRCHGDPAAHVRQPSRQTIVNPARLPDAERDSVCEQCHLNGEARVTNPGKGFGNFQPGQRLEEAFTVFVYDRPKSGLKVVSHAEQLALSACRKADAKLWCGTCHQPHGEAISISGRCAQCHPALSGKHPAAAASCESCHMPKRPARDGGHTPFTDHRIQRNSIPQPGAASPTMLRAWRQPVGPALAERNLGLAYVIAGERDGSALFLNRGYELLAAVFPKFSQDVDVLANLGMVLFLKDRRADAEKLLRAALAARPSEPGLWEKLGVILKSAGQKERAALALEKAIALDPARETAYHLLAEMESDPKKRRAVLERYLLFNPKSLIAREALMKLPVP
jgi:tetratricopeptide (TPR) repeat protein